MVCLYSSAFSDRLVFWLDASHLKMFSMQVNMLRFHGSYQLDQMDNREVFQLLLLVCLRLYLFLLLLVYVSNKVHKIY